MRRSLKPDVFVPWSRFWKYIFIRVCGTHGFLYLLSTVPCHFQVWIQRLSYQVCLKFQHLQHHLLAIHTSPFWESFAFLVPHFGAPAASSSKAAILHGAESSHCSSFSSPAQPSTSVLNLATGLWTDVAVSSFRRNAAPPVLGACTTSWNGLGCHYFPASPQATHGMHSTESKDHHGLTLVPFLNSDLFEKLKQHLNTEFCNITSQSGSLYALFVNGFWTLRAAASERIGSTWWNIDPRTSIFPMEMSTGKLESILPIGVRCSSLVRAPYKK